METVATGCADSSVFSFLQTEIRVSFLPKNTAYPLPRERKRTAASACPRFSSKYRSLSGRGISGCTSSPKAGNIAGPVSRVSEIKRQEISRVTAGRDRNLVAFIDLVYYRR